MKHKIKGILMQPSSQNFPFQGEILCREDNSFNGELADRWGLSEIEGRLRFGGREVYFAKVYLHHPNNLIFCRFEKKGDLWLGGYTGEPVGTGEAQCELYQDAPKIDWAARLKTEKFNPETAEANANICIETLIKDGLLIREKDKLKAIGKLKEFLGQ